MARETGTAPEPTATADAERPDEQAFTLPRRSSRAEAVALAVETRILDEDLEPGIRLGTRRELGAMLGVAPSTVSEAIKLLEDRVR